MVTKTPLRREHGALVTHGRSRFLVGSAAEAVLSVLARRGLRMDRDDVFNLACMSHSTLYMDLDETIDALIAARLVRQYGDGIIGIAGGTFTITPVDSDTSPQWFQGLDLEERIGRREEVDCLPDVTRLMPGETGVVWE
jgi:hypothetical protein